MLDRLSAGNSSIDAASLLLVVAHPDDEIIGVGGQLARLLGACVLYVTDGAPRSMVDALAAGCATREAYAAVRRREAERALALAGIPSKCIHALSIADQQASFFLAELTRLLERFFLARQVRVVLTQAYEGGHPDHDATAFAVHGACVLIGERAPVVLEMAGYHTGPEGMSTYEFLPHASQPVITVELDEAQRKLKSSMLACHTSQSRTLSQFSVHLERFRRAPCYNFTSPPHAGRLWYEHFDWGMTGLLWRRLAKEARLTLGLNRQCCHAL